MPAIASQRENAAIRVLLARHLLRRDQRLPLHIKTRIPILIRHCIAPRAVLLRQHPPSRRLESLILPHTHRQLVLRHRVLACHILIAVPELPGLRHTHNLDLRPVILAQCLAPLFPSLLPLLRIQKLPLDHRHRLLLGKRRVLIRRLHHPLQRLRALIFVFDHPEFAGSLHRDAAIPQCFLRRLIQRQQIQLQVNRLLTPSAPARDLRHAPPQVHHGAVAAGLLDHIQVLAVPVLDHRQLDRRLVIHLAHFAGDLFQPHCQRRAPAPLPGHHLVETILRRPHHDRAKPPHAPHGINQRLQTLRIDPLPRVHLPGFQFIR